jgi:hypothetical protein
MADEPVYLTRLEIENVRCFAEQQVLGLTTPSGAPAMWTTILGENGTGKTTLLKALALGGVFDEEAKEQRLPRLARSWIHGSCARHGSRSASIGVQFGGLDPSRAVAAGLPFIDARWAPSGASRYIRDHGVDVSLPPVFGYGASRLPSSTSLGDAEIRPSVDSLRSSGATLLALPAQGRVGPGRRHARPSRLLVARLRVAEPLSGARTSSSTRARRRRGR